MPGAQAPAWRPSASMDALRLRARLLARARAFFDDRRVLEVETPVLGRATVTDRHLASFPVASGDDVHYLQTSPEAFMKRLVAAGSGSIYQIARVFREGERGRWHNPEFTLIEWYRVGWDDLALRLETDALIRHLLPDHGLGPMETLTYSEAFSRYLGISDVLNTDAGALSAYADKAGLQIAPLGEDVDAWRDALLSHGIQPHLGRGCVSVLHDYPPSQAIMARTRGEPPTAARFEVYVEGIELANGFHELSQAAVLRARFVQDQRERQDLGLPVPAFDEALLAALEAGFPDCAGVALGFDRVVALAARAEGISAVLAFDWERR